MMVNVKRKKKLFLFYVVATTAFVLHGWIELVMIVVILR